MRVGSVVRILAWENSPLFLAIERSKGEWQIEYEDDSKFAQWTIWRITGGHIGHVYTQIGRELEVIYESR